MTLDARVSIFDRFREGDLDDYLALCASCRPGFDVAEMKARAVAALRFHRGEADASEVSASKKVEQRWYLSLAAKQPDYSVYGDDHFVIEVWSCWSIYSRPLVRRLAGIVDRLGDVGSAVDIGCGMGYSTAALKETFPAARVFGTNVEGSLQYDVASKVGASYGFELLPDVARLPDGADLVLASEYFEHWERPVDHLRDVLSAARPRVLVIANAFGSRAVGHFDAYKFGRDVVPAKLAGRRFNRALVDAGFEKLETGFWNDRPTVWRKK